MVIVGAALCSLTVVFFVTSQIQSKSPTQGRDIRLAFARSECKPDPYKGNCKKLCSAICDFEKSTAEDCECCSWFYKRCSGDSCECYQPPALERNVNSANIPCLPNCNLFGDMKSCDQHGILHRLSWYAIQTTFDLTQNAPLRPCLHTKTSTSCYRNVFLINYNHQQQTGKEMGLQLQWVRMFCRYSGKFSWLSKPGPGEPIVEAARAHNTKN